MHLDERCASRLVQGHGQHKQNGEGEKCSISDKIYSIFSAVAGQKLDRSEKLK
jgi:hypothetical protein